MSSVFPDWKKFAVHQQRPNTGCIPTGYEMILRAAGCEGIDFNSFQDDFDLDKDLMPGKAPRNNFASVAEAIREKYPRIDLRHHNFPTGKEKLAFVEKQIAKQRPVLISLAMKPFGGQGWHIMPVVDATDDKLMLLKYVKESGEPVICSLSKTEFVRIHDDYDGGDDVAYLHTCGGDSDEDPSD